MDEVFILIEAANERVKAAYPEDKKSAGSSTIPPGAKKTVNKQSMTDFLKETKI
jgi:hypothetical protein